MNGAGYTDVKAQLPALNLLVFISVVAAALFLWNIRRRGWVLPIIAVGLWSFVSVVIGGIYPTIIQKASVEPNELQKETRYIQRNINAMFPEKTFADTKIPLRIVATDIRTGRPVVLKEGNVARAVRASISLPIYMRPVKWGEALLVDGGMTNPIPCDVAMAEGAEAIVSMSFGSSLDTPLTSPVRLLNQIVRVSASNLIRVHGELHRTLHKGEIVEIYPSFDHVHSFFNFHTMEEIIQRGEEASEAALPRIRAALHGITNLASSR